MCGLAVGWWVVGACVVCDGGGGGRLEYGGSVVGLWCEVRQRKNFDIIPGPFLTDFYFSPQLRAIPRAPGDTLHIVLILIKNDAPARPRPITPPYSETFSYGLGTGADLPTVRGSIPLHEGLFYGMHHIIEDLEEYSSMVGSHVLALLFIISQIKP